jgi:hypothetical protein
VLTPRVDTKLDWTAYMEQVDMFLDGEDDYSEIQGETGPLVYVSIQVSGPLLQGVAQR